MTIYRHFLLMLFLITLFPACTPNMWRSYFGGQSDKTETQTSSSSADTDTISADSSAEILDEEITSVESEIISVSSNDAFEIEAGIIEGTSSDSVTATSTSASTSTQSPSPVLTASATSTATATAEIPARTIDLTTTLPTTATTSDCEISGGALQITKTGSDFAESCSITFTVSNDEVSGRMISVDADRVNLFDHESLDGLSSTDVLLYNAASTANDAAKATGSWFSNASYPSHKPTLTDGTATIKKVSGLVQFFKTKPGAEFELSFNADTTNIGDEQLFYLATQFFDENFKALTFYNPNSDSTATALNNYVNYDIADGDFTDTIKLKMIDCDAHQTYVGGSGVETSDVNFNFCESSGTALTNEDGTVYTEDNIAYASIGFYVNWSRTTNGSADLKWVELHDMEEIRYEVLDNNGAVLASGYGGDSFYVPTVSDAASVKLTLRTLKNSESPRIRTLTVSATQAATVTIGTKKKSFSNPRLGGLNVFGPRSEWLDVDVEQRSLCVDPFTSETISCMTFADRYNGSMTRLGIYQGYFTATLNSTGDDYDLTLNRYGELALKRALEYSEGGVDYNILLIKSGGFLYNSPTDSRSWAVTTDAASLTDPTGTRSATEQGAYMLTKYAREVARLFTGSHSYTFQYVDAGRVETLPKIEQWEVFNEDNISETTWAGWDAWGKITDTTTANTVAQAMAEIMNDMAGAIKESVSDAKIAYVSFAAYYGPVFNTDNINLIGPYIDADVFSINHFHPYTNEDGIHGTEDLIKERWAATETVLASHGLLNDYQLDFGEYGFTRQIYDPACVYNSTSGVYETTTTPNLEWSRGFGETEHGKLLARQTVTLLSLPADKVKPYGSYSGEAEAWGRTINADGSGGLECWRSFSAVNFYYFERVAGTGILSGVDEATTYQLTSGGIAHAVLAKNLSISDPYETTLAADVSDDEYLSVDAFSVSDGTVIALSWYRVYDFVSDFMDYVSGVKDDGFTDVKMIDLTPSGVTFSTATLISLTNGTESELTVTDGIVKNVPVGALPVLVKLR